MRIRLMLISIIATVATALLPLSVSNVSAASTFDPLQQSCTEVNNNSVDTPEICKDLAADSDKTVSDTVSKTVNLLTFAAGIISVIIIIIAGINMVMSSGDSSKVNRSRDAIIYTSIGLIVIALSRTIVTYIVYRRFL